MSLKWFIDMDGVFVDFLGSACKWFMMSPSRVEKDWPTGEWGTNETISEFYGLPHKAFWAALTTEFWANADWTPDGQEFISFMLQFNPCVLSSPSYKGASGKQIWLKKNTPFYTKRKYLLGPTKHYCARPGAILIDDYEENCAAWIKHGGAAILYPRHWNRLYYIQDPLEYVKTEVEYYNAVERNFKVAN